METLERSPRCREEAGPFQLFTPPPPPASRAIIALIIAPFHGEGFANTEALVHYAALHTWPWC